MASGHTASIRRFASASIEPERTAPLPAGHPALSEGRTIYMATVTASKDSPRFIVSGHNNPKLGKMVTKGPRKGWPIFHLALEERATCPRSCLQWDSCYGNSMPFSRRHTPDADFERFLIAEVVTLARQHPEGLLIRLHSLGDFYSVEYVYIWASLLAQFPQLHVFGYTAHRVSDGDAESQRIARAIKAVTDGAWQRFAIRTSGGLEERSTTLVVDDAATGEAAGAIMCPAQTKATEACATCGLCWVESARDKAIGFLRHGRKLATGPRARKAKAAPTPADLAKLDEINARLISEGRAPVTFEPKPAVDVSEMAQKLASLGRVTVSEPGPVRTVWPATLGPRAAQLLAFMQAETSRQGTAVDGLAAISLADISRGSGIPTGSLGFAIYELEKRGILHVTPGRGKRKSAYRLAADQRAAQGEIAKSTPKPAKEPKPTISRKGGRAVFAEAANDPDDDGEERFSRRVVDAVLPTPPKTMTRFLMGDPPPGRTPWAAA